MLIIAFVFMFQEAVKPDIVTLRDGDVFEAEIHEIKMYTVVFTYSGERHKQGISKFLIEKIQYSSGRTQEFKPLPKVAGTKDRYKVIITTDPHAVEGLFEVGRVQGESIFNGQAGREGAFRSLRKVAARRHIPIVLMAENPERGSRVYGIGYRLLPFNHIPKGKKE